MEDESIPRKVTRLRAKLQQIGAENRSYFQMKSRGETQMTFHRKREARIVEIKLQLRFHTSFYVIDATFSRSRCPDLLGDPQFQR